MSVIGIFMMVQYYIPNSAVQHPKELLLQWKQPLNAFIILLAIGGIVSLHFRKIMKRDSGWGYSLVTLLSMGAMIFVGMVFGIKEGTLFSKWFKYLITPVEATMFSLLAFFVASAAFRAFMARSTGATVLLISGFIVMLALIPVVENNMPFLSEISAFILTYLNTAAKRAILIGVSLGAVSVALKNIFGIDKTLLDSSR
jgi:hypothetical protein